MPQKPQPFSQYILRTPASPVGFYLNLLKDYSTEKLQKAFGDRFVKEAIRLASPELFVALNKWQENPNVVPKDKKEALEMTLLKYIARLSARCTPFGIFAGCSVGTMANETKMVLAEKEKHKRFTQFDMHFWVALLQEFGKRESVREHLVYYPNNSVYRLGNFYRFVEYKYIKTKREHHITALRKTVLLESLYTKAQNGITITQMIEWLADDDSEKEEALEYVHELIDCQFLTSNIDAVLTGSDDWTRVFEIIAIIPALAHEYATLQEIKKQFDILDKTVVPESGTYETIKNLIATMGLEIEDKYLFQTDLTIETTANELNNKIPGKVLQALAFLKGIQRKRTPTNLEIFKKAFVERYENRKMDLVTVLDTETGIGYLQNIEMNDVHDILDGFSFGSKSNTEVEQTWTAVDFILEKKYRIVCCKMKTQ